jgi:hypothetical protein
MLSDHIQDLRNYITLLMICTMNYYTYIQHKLTIMSNTLSLISFRIFRLHYLHILVLIVWHILINH